MTCRRAWEWFAFAGSPYEAQSAETTARGRKVHEAIETLLEECPEWELISTVHDEIILRKRKGPLAPGNPEVKLSE